MSLFYVLTKHLKLNVSVTCLKKNDFRELFFLFKKKYSFYKIQLKYICIKSICVYLNVSKIMTNVFEETNRNSISKKNDLFVV